MTPIAPRIEPVSPPYPPELQKVLDAIMPAGVPPLTLFTTLARVPRIWGLAAVALLATATAIAANIKGERRHTQHYWEDLVISSFYSSWA